MNILKFIFLSAVAFSAYSRVVNATTQEFNSGTTYVTPGTRVVYYQTVNGVIQVGVFENSWFLPAGTIPVFDDSRNGWKQIGSTVSVSNLNDLNGTAGVPSWINGAIYTGGNIVKIGAFCYKAKWWNQIDPQASGAPWDILAACPANSSVSNPWNSANRTTIPVVTQADTTSTKIKLDTTTIATIKTSIALTSSNSSSIISNNGSPSWSSSDVYLAGSVVFHVDTCYKAKWWTKNDTPKRSGSLSNQWDSPWEQLGSCPTSTLSSGLPANLNTGINGTLSADVANKAAAQAPTPVVVAASGQLAEQAATSAAAAQTASLLTVALPPVIPKSLPPTLAVSSTAPTTLPGDGYAFLRKVTADDWEWLFPVRSGKVNAGGGSRNIAPFALLDGSTDRFDLKAFVRAVLEYNNWAKKNGFKQFLNEGTLKQQAEEFLVFWAKSSRETSGTWSTASSPWIVDDTDGGSSVKVWKGGLYWVEEVGYETNSQTGKSTKINYVDSGSTSFPPSSGRSYYGRGVIQLSWNYNYGAFSHWLYDNGLFKTAKDNSSICKIDSRNKLLDYPNLVADCGDLSIMSGIWFWMTPQGAKPSSHDVLYGDIINISTATTDRGLPQTNNNYLPKVAKGETNDPEVFAFRLGTIINIVNGGLECNKAARLHGGPVQRVSYYNAYASQFNKKYGVNATRIREATNVWTASVTDASNSILQSATCYNQKSYYGW